ncbi:MAG: hypothetical protein JWM33_1949 [Caulobacteraceae bacterium]|nr:hypothetical protein [Caulobacteraceae bacterium]
MPVNLSIKNAPDDVVEKLRRRAVANHRSLQGELMAIIEMAANQQGKVTLAEVARRVKASGLRTASDSVAMIREDRDR